MQWDFYLECQTVETTQKENFNELEVTSSSC